jgi:hypothetical protein
MKMTLAYLDYRHKLRQIITENEKNTPAENNIEDVLTEFFILSAPEKFATNNSLFKESTRSIKQRN